MRNSSLAFLHEGSATWRSSASALASRETPAHTLMFHRIFPLIHCVTTTRFLLDSLFEAFWRRFLRGHLYDPPQASSPGFQTETRREESTARLSAFFLFGNSSSLFLHPFALFSDALASTLFEGFRSFLPFLPYTIHSYLCYTVTSLIERPKHSLIYFVNLHLLALIRDHWTIENRLHYRRDVTLVEDACQVRKGSAPHALAALHSFVLALFDFCQVPNVKQHMRCLDASPLQAARLLLRSLEEH